MKKITLSAFVFLILFAISSCKKYGNGFVKGTVLETGTNLPVANALVTLNWAEADPIDPNIYEPVNSTTTDSQGQFIIYYEKKRKTVYTITFDEKDHWQTSYNNIKVNDSKKTDLKVFMDHTAYVKLRIKKTLTNTHIISVYVGLLNSLTIDKQNSYDTLLTQPFRIRGNGSESISWTIKDPGNANSPLFPFGKYTDAAQRYIVLYHTI